MCSSDLIGAAGFGLALAALGFDVRVGHISIVTPVLIIIYVVSMRGVFRFEVGPGSLDLRLHRSGRMAIFPDIRVP